MKEFTFQCGCGYQAGIVTYMDAAEHYVVCANTHAWTLTCNGCKAVRRIEDGVGDPRETGQAAMAWCATHLVECFKKTPEEFFIDLTTSLNKYEEFLMRFLCTN